MSGLDRGPLVPRHAGPAVRWGSLVTLVVALGWTACPSMAAAVLAQAPPAPSSAAPAEPAPLPVDVTGATDIQYDAAGERYTFRGPRVVVVRGTERLEAPEILYDASARRVVLPRRGTVSTPTMELAADHMTAELGRRHLVAEGNVAGRFLDEGVWTSLTAAGIEADDRPGLRRIVATGDVVAVRADEELRGDRVVYNRATRNATVDGHAVLSRGTDRLRADHVAADLATHDAEAAGHVLLDREREDMHASADRATYSERTQTAVLSGHAVLTRGRDSVVAETITVHVDRHLAVADGRPTITAYPQAGQGGTSP